MLINIRPTVTLRHVDQNKAKAERLLIEIKPNLPKS